ncbi:MULTISPECIES: cell division protein ZapA [Peptostreptococcus]|jgi:cell division protein ZapA|uniref:Cell division protein ZapA n=2 Tax=Peptostreptococcus anaerobius TaxID=1261 RepID=D3MPW7_9FIRM|nr:MULTISPECIES: cell division protein ZapA [Peptostreptococcus]EFD05837.1 cell division protein ZapA [Peptostreptococcus anaerobius 653-L]KXI14865.1 cell division protein ZapA [Peptostreptococcus anaerobius]MBS5596071.1 cell division protein ZapA [Peptostreptococcus sp.]MCB6982127.1 cell division protein ZapA [Peptostreptococcus anaerobius]MCQ5149876.1 cell division protein ZapA [Peptostreptococcus anaerobius]
MNRVSVRIDGVDYNIAGEKPEAEIVKVAKYIDNELKEIFSKAPSLTKINAAILMSVNVADKLFDARSENDQLKDKIEKLESSITNTSEDLEKEFDSVLEKLAQSDEMLAKVKSERDQLKLDLEERDSKIESISLAGSSASDPDIEKKIKSMQMQIKEMENKVAVAEAMATEFQNKAYNIQLNYEELKNSIK